MAETLWDRTLGTNIGNMTNYGGLAAAFDGNTSQSNVQGAALNNIGPTGGYVGKNLGAGYPITKIVARTPTNTGFTQSGNATIRIYAKNSAPSGPTDGTQLATSGPTSHSAGTDYTLTSSDQVTQYQYVWFANFPSNAGNDAYCCELSIYVDIVTGGQPLVKRRGGVPFASPNRGVW